MVPVRLRRFVARRFVVDGVEHPRVMLFVHSYALTSNALETILSHFIVGAPRRRRRGRR